MTWTTPIGRKIYLTWSCLSVRLFYLSIRLTSCRRPSWTRRLTLNFCRSCHPTCRNSFPTANPFCQPHLYQMSPGYSGYPYCLCCRARSCRQKISMRRMACQPASLGTTDFLCRRLCPWMNHPWKRGQKRSLFLWTACLLTNPYRESSRRRVLWRFAWPYPPTFVDRQPPSRPQCHLQSDLARRSVIVSIDRCLQSNVECDLAPHECDPAGSHFAATPTGVASYHG